jgi:hypothetical protein
MARRVRACSVPTFTIITLCVLSLMQQLMCRAGLQVWEAGDVPEKPDGGLTRARL